MLVLDDLQIGQPRDQQRHAGDAEQHGDAGAAQKGIALSVDVFQRIPTAASEHRHQSSSPPGWRIISITLHSSGQNRSEEHTSELQTLMRTSYAVFCLKKKTQHNII